MSNYPESADVFVNKTGSDDIASSDPNNAFDGIEATQGLVGALGKPQSWSTTLMTLLRKHRRDMRVEATGGTLYVRAGEAVLENTDGSRYAFRRNTTDVTVAATDIDVGSMVIGTYYVYASGGTAATTAPILFSTDAYAPSAIGTAPYRKIGWFYNSVAAALAVTYAGDIKDGGNEVNFLSAIVVSSSVSVGTGDTSILSVPFVGNGRRTKVGFSNISNVASAEEFYLSIFLDGAVQGSVTLNEQTSSQKRSDRFEWDGVIAAGPHTIEGRVRRDPAATIYTRDGTRLTVEEL